MTVFFTVLVQELKISSRHLGKVLANFLFFLIFISLFFLLEQNEANQRLSNDTVILFSLLSCLIFASGEFLKKDFDDGSVEQILLALENFEVFILAKILANWLISCLPALIAISFIKPEMNFLILILLASLAINFICCFCGSLSILGNSAPAIAVIALPLIIPVLLMCYGEFFVSLKLLSGITIFLGIILTFFTAKIVKIAAE